MTPSRGLKTKAVRRGAVVCLVLLAPPTCPAADAAVTNIQAVHRHGQTFVTWKDVAEGEAGTKYRYSLYRSDTPITAQNLGQAELCFRGVLFNSAKLYGSAFNLKDRLDPAKPYAVIVTGGQPLPAWSGLAVRTVTKPGQAYYAVVATDEKLNPASAWYRARAPPRKPSTKSRHRSSRSSCTTRRSAKARRSPTPPAVGRTAL